MNKLALSVIEARARLNQFSPALTNRAMLIGCTKLTCFWLECARSGNTDLLT